MKTLVVGKMAQLVNELSVPPTCEKRVPQAVRAPFRHMSTRSGHLRQLAQKCGVRAAAAKDAVTRASFEAERKQLLILAEQAEKLERRPVAGRPRGMTKR